MEDVLSTEEIYSMFWTGIIQEILKEKLKHSTESERIYVYKVITAATLL